VVVAIKETYVFCFKPYSSTGNKSLRDLDF